jgi:uncharacterized protein (TIGR03067 family)
MRRIVWVLASVLLVVLSLGSDVPKEYDGATENGNLQGTWQVIAVELPSQGRHWKAGWVQTFRDGKCWPADGIWLSVGTYTTDASHKPARMETTDLEGQDQGRIRKYIYRIDGDSLRIAWEDERETYPETFDGDDVFVITLKRMKR